MTIRNKTSTVITSGLAVCLSILCTINCEAQFKKPVVRTITSGNNVFEVHDYSDTVEVLNTTTMDVETVIKNPHPIPVKLNHIDIYTKEDVKTLPSLTEVALRGLFIKALYGEIGRFTTGRYRILISNVVIDAKGKIVYYDFDGFEKAIPKSNNWQAVYQTKTEKWRSTIKQTIEKGAGYKPAYVYGSAVPFRFSDEGVQQFFIVNNGMIQ